MMETCPSTFLISTWSEIILWKFELDILQCTLYTYMYKESFLELLPFLNPNLFSLRLPYSNSVVAALRLPISNSLVPALRLPILHFLVPALRLPDLHSLVPALRLLNSLVPCQLLLDPLAISTILRENLENMKDQLHFRRM